MRRLLLLGLLVAFLTATGAGHGLPVSFQSNTTDAGQAALFSFNHTVETDSNLIMVGIATDADHTVNSINFSGQSMTQVSEAVAGKKAGVSMWYLNSPPIGNGTVSVELAASDKYVAAASTYSAVNVSDPVGTLENASGTSTIASVVVQSEDDDLVVDTVATASNTISAGLGQTVRWKRGRADDKPAGGSYQAGATTVNMSWTLDSSQDWSIIGVSLNHDNPPTQSYVAPTPADGTVQDQAYAYINTTVSDDVGLDTCTLTVDGANQTMTRIGSATSGSCNANITGLAEGDHTYQAYVNDTLGQTSSPGQRTITVDTTAPTVTLNSPANDSQNLYPDQTLSYTPEDNIDTSMSCSLYLDGSLNQTQTSANGTSDSFSVTGLTETTHTWRVDCTDDASNTGQSQTWEFEVDVSPTLGSLTAASDPIKGGDEQVITPDSVDDPNGDNLQFLCDYTKSAVLSGNTICKEGTTDFMSPYDNMQCSFDTQQIDGVQTVFCAAYDTEFYSSTSTSNFTIDSTPPSLTTNSVAGDMSSPYIDNVDDGFTNISVEGESGMQCRFSTSDVGYSGMSSVNQCTIDGSTATCPADPAQGFPDLYVSCKDGLGNENNATNNLDVTDLLVDYTLPTTTTDATVGPHRPNYTVNLSEADNVDTDPTTTYCIDQTDTCTPSTSIDDGQSITFDETDRGRNYLRIDSTDDASNTNSTSTTVDINQLPDFTGAADNATTIQGGSTVKIETNATDGDAGQELSLYVCKETGATSSGCNGPAWCSNTTATADPSCTFTAPTDDSFHEWHAYVFDALDAAATANPRSGNFTTDSTPPVITIVDPENKTYTQDSAPAEISIDEKGQKAYYQLDAGANTTMSKISSTLFSATLSGLADDQHNITFWAQDQYGNWNRSGYRYFTVDTTAGDTTPPSLTAIRPQNGSSHNAPFTARVNSSEDLAYANISINGGANQTMTKDTNRSFTYVLGSTLDQGQNTVRFWGTDTSSKANTGASKLISFTYDTEVPQYEPSLTGISPSSPTTEDSVVCHTRWTDGIELANATLSHNSTGTFSNTTVTMSGTADWANKTIGSMDPGGYTCRSWGRDTVGNVNTTSTSFTVTDATPPVLNGQTYRPNASARLDPNVTINVSIDVTDQSTIDSVILQYRNGSDPYTNTTMSLDTGDTYTGNFTPSTPGKWKFRVVANDTVGNTVTGTETTLNVAKDRSFTLTDTLPGSISATQQDGEVTVGNITVDNTGDVPLDITSSINQSWMVLSNTSFNLADGTTKNITVTLNASDAPIGIFQYGIDITGTNSSFNNTRTRSGQAVIQQSDGPLLELDLVQFSSEVTKGEKDITYQVEVENIGTESADGTWLAWELPSAFTLSSGALNRSIGSLLPGDTAQNTITIDVPSSVEDQKVTLTARTAGGGVDDVLERTITIGNPTIITRSSGGGGGGGGGGSIGGGTTDEVLSGQLVLNSTRRIQVVRGNTTSFPVTVTNIFDGTIMRDISVSVKGLPASAVQVARPATDRLEFGENATYTITINGPQYLQPGTRELTVRLEGRVLDAGIYPGNVINRTFLDERFITLRVYSVSQDEAAAAVENATETISNTTDDGQQLRQLVQLAQQALDEDDYDQAHRLAQQVTRLVQAREQARSILSALEQDLAGTGTDTASRLGLGPDHSTTRNLMDLARAAMARGDHTTALERAQQARLAYQEEADRTYPVATAVNHWQTILAGLVTAIVLGAIIAYLTRRRRISRKIRKLDEREDRLLHQLVDLQVEYYDHESVPKERFQDRKGAIRDELGDVRQERIELRRSIPLTYGIGRTLDRLEGEREEVIERLQDLQEQYYEDETIGKQRFQEESEALTERLAEIEEETARVQIRQYMRER